MAAGVEIGDVGLLLGYIRVLENCILHASEEMNDDPVYAERVLAMMANRIKASMEAAEDAAAVNRTLH
jgi:hypothetical protein